MKKKNVIRSNFGKSLCSLRVEENRFNMFSWGPESQEEGSSLCNSLTESFFSESSPLSSNLSDFRLPALLPITGPEKPLPL